MLNYYLFQKFKFIKKMNYLIKILNDMLAKLADRGCVYVSH
jgi:hypothetical protein